jgi:hypothetical protein
VDLLLQQGADVDILNKVDKTTAELHWRSIANVARFLAEYNGDANIRNKIWSTTLDTAQYGVDEEVSCSSSGMRRWIAVICGVGQPLHYASRSGRLENRV